MTDSKETLFEKYLSPLFQHVLLDQNALMAYYRGKDWEAESDRLRNPTIQYPDYYESQNFHGIKGGYLNLQAALTYDAVTQYFLPPNEAWVRQDLLRHIRCQPRRIVDLGCGTGSTTLLLKQAFPDAEVIGIDLSPYMLVAAADKAQAAQLDIRWIHGNAEQVPFPDNSVDLVTASLLFHETPLAATQAILKEALRLLCSGGEMLVLDGSQSTLRNTLWLTQIFEEPYIQDYAAGSLDAWMGAAGFGDIRTEPVWMLHQVTRGLKPLSYQRIQFETPTIAAEWVPG
ncbi:MULTISPECIES: class I SAM-dependent methyltransferase [unclassified Leptolyngbya]|uniref:class I SAM-dependent methyltransferase n=1 Tax=unclassified Leptolyngbya TaxID=2650499 RepID=UPI0016848B85|nr:MULTISPECIES: class I SAM-dependent methyltransferase [unclassified Leptolyngbya]MBD1912397.1 class I SAM-dependent methyltransferase [Leptolyngbya sp. FACHB-8]MBD2154801.1 class I SAM-dependent methyltransferase [Leptolyngbya sp. FACHB-16]